MEYWLSRLWYSRVNPLSLALYPLSVVYRALAKLRKVIASKQQHAFSVPVIVIGNITTGGVGKTPFVIEIASRLMAMGLNVGIVSRGYKASTKYFPKDVQPSDSAVEVGDEPLLMAKKLRCPVVISPNRNQAVRHLMKQYSVDVILSDDGLQHYKMARAMEIAIIDGQRQFGNGFCLPAGPLRETKKRLSRVDMVFENEGSGKTAEPMRLGIESIYDIHSGEKIHPSSLTQPVVAMTGIGNPERFFNSLRSMEIAFKPMVFPDHYAFRPKDFAAISEASIIMTEKDAVKCQSFAPSNSYCLAVKANISDKSWQRFIQILEEKTKDYDFIIPQ